MKIHIKTSILTCVLAVFLTVGYPMEVFAGEGAGQEKNGVTWVQKEILDLSGCQGFEKEDGESPVKDNIYVFTLSNELDHVVYYHLVLLPDNAEMGTFMGYRLRSEDGIYLLGSEEEWVEAWELGMTTDRREFLQPGGKRSYYLEWDGSGNMAGEYQMKLNIEMEIGSEGLSSMAYTDYDEEKADRLIRLWEPVGSGMTPLDLIMNLLYAVAACAVGIGVWIMYSDRQSKWLPIRIKRKGGKV